MMAPLVTPTSADALSIAETPQQLTFGEPGVPPAQSQALAAMIADGATSAAEQQDRPIGQTDHHDTSYSFAHMGSDLVEGAFTEVQTGADGAVSTAKLGLPTTGGRQAGAVVYLTREPDGTYAMAVRERFGRGEARPPSDTERQLALLVLQDQGRAGDMPQDVIDGASTALAKASGGPTGSTPAAWDGKIDLTPGPIAQLLEKPILNPTQHEQLKRALDNPLTAKQQNTLRQALDNPLTAQQRNMLRQAQETQAPPQLREQANNAINQALDEATTQTQPSRGGPATVQQAPQPDTSQPATPPQTPPKP
jgi:hypothetical protein